MSKLAGQVLPPLLLLPLFVMPMEVFTSLYWLAGVAAAALSIGTLLRLVKQGKERRADWSLAMRPALTLGIFAAASVVGFVSGRAESEEADTYALALAQEMRAACVRDRGCPAAPPGWRTPPGDRALRTVAGKRVEYRRIEEGRFLVTVRHPLEMMFEVRGGVAEEVRGERVVR